MVELNRVYIGDALTVLKTFPDEFVHCVVTSPPYWGLRDYGVEGQLGLENTPGEYIENIVKIFKEVKRVLRKDGTVWLNLGDSYMSHFGISKKVGGFQGRDMERNPAYKDAVQIGRKVRPNEIGLKDKDLVGIPWRTAFALQEDGWYLRSDIIWSKPNPMPESVNDRPSKSHEYIFLLSQNAQYYFDQDAVREPLSKLTIADKRNVTGRHTQGEKQVSKYLNSRGNEPDLPSWYRSKTFVNPEAGRNLRTVWTITTHGYSEAHFATFPEKLPERCIKAGTSEKGCCPKCGNSWTREVQFGEVQSKGGGYVRHEGNPNKLTNGIVKTTMIQREHITKGWQPSCSCDQKPIPCIVLDPFMGSGTTAKAAIKLGRSWCGIELNPEYAKLIKKRISRVQTEMF